MNQDERNTPQVKICGLTVTHEAAACAGLGADAIGCVFYPPSPRYVTEDQAAGISRALVPMSCKVVGVFVNESFEGIMRKVDKCSLNLVQLHGCEPPDLVDKIERAGVPVIKSLFVNGNPDFSAAAAYRASAFLTECAGGPLPGGNAAAWNWGEADQVAAGHRLILAGGLSPDNVNQAIEAARPDAVDVSSALEAAPCQKNLDAVKRFLDAVSISDCTRKIRRIFQ